MVHWWWRIRYVLEEMLNNWKPEEIEEVVNNLEYKKNGDTDYVDCWVE